MIDSSIEQVLLDKGYIFADFKGTSMNPLLKSDRDKVYIEKPATRLNKGDVALYKRSNGSYVLHRVYKVMPSSYVFWGDNHCLLEYGVEDEAIIGVAKGYYKGEKYVDFAKSKGYKVYKFFWCGSVGFRKFLTFFKRVFAKIASLFKKKNKNSN